ncbi:NAD-dependent protein deacetylase [Streptomyces sp. NPDC018610]|uniref:NAD-dependent protein deacetylase n=1 Tax=Streptomyces sp. NPDC018610 TaxID=3365049 RepID=UPI0037A147A1
MDVRALPDPPAGAAAPRPSAPPDAHGERTVERLLAAGRVLVLSGAGISTESGIPDYRGPTGSRRRHTPMTYQEFTGSEDSRRRYWARSHLGWETIVSARPNAGHRAVARLAAAGRVMGVITQNVDGLHAAAGTREAVELHGSLHRVICLTCHNTVSRAHLDQRLREANPGFRDIAARMNPDGDAEPAREQEADFHTVPCQVCGTGTLKPDVVFFGESVPKPRVAHCYELVDAASALLVAGSSLTVMSGLRFVRRAAKQGKPVAIVNQGPTRGDDLAAVRLDLPLGAALTELADRLGA